MERHYPGAERSDLQAFLRLAGEHPGAPIVAFSSREASHLSRTLTPEREVLTAYGLARQILGFVPQWVQAWEQREAVGDLPAECPDRAMALQAITWALGRQESREDWLGECLARYRRRLRHAGRWDLYLYCEEALSAIREPLYDELLLFEAPNQPPLVHRLARAAARRVHPWGDAGLAVRAALGADPPLPSGDPLPRPDRCHLHLDAFREAEAVVASVERALAHCSPEQIALVSRWGGRLRQEVVEALDQRGIPFSSEEGDVALSTPVGRILLAYVRLGAYEEAGGIRHLLRNPSAAPEERTWALSNRPTQQDLQRLLRSPLVSSLLEAVRASFPAEAPGVRWTALDQAQGAPAGLDQDAGLLDEEEMEEVAWLDAMIAWLRDQGLWQQLYPEGGSPHTALLRLIYRAPAPELRQVLGGVNLEAFARFAEHLQGACGWRLALTQLEELAEEPVKSRLQPHRVHLLNPLQINPGAYRHIILFRLNEKTWPTWPRQEELRLWSHLWRVDQSEARRRLTRLEEALYRAVWRGLGPGGQVEAHALDTPNAAPSRYLNGVERAPLPADLPRDPLARAIWLEGERQRALRQVEIPEESALAVARWFLVRSALPTPPPEPAPVEQARPLFSRPVLVSPSQLETYRDCPRRFLYAYSYRLEDDDEAGHLGFGNLIHRVLQEAYRGGDRQGPPAALPVEDRRAWALRRYFEVARQEGLLRAFYRAQALERRRLGWRLLWAELAAPPPDPASCVLLTEHSFEIELAAGSVRLRGRIDRVDREADGIRLVDYKTGKRPQSWRVQRSELLTKRVQEHCQSLAYTLAAHYDPAVQDLGPLRTIEFRFLREQAGADEGFSPPVAPPPDPSQAEERIVAIAAQIEREEFPYGERPPCRFCSFAFACAYCDHGLEESS